MAALAHATTSNSNNNKQPLKKTGLVGRARFVLKTANGNQVIKSINSKRRLLMTRVVKPVCANKRHCKECKT